MLPLRSPLAKLADLRPAGPVLSAALLSSLSPLAAQALQPVATEAPVLEVQSDLVAPSPDAGSTATLAPGLAAPAAAVAQRSTLWVRRGAAAVGLGVQAAQAHGSASYSSLTPFSAGGDRAGLAPANLVVGMALETSARSRLVVDTPLLPAPRLDDSLNPGTSTREVRLGLQVKPADPLKSLRGGQLFKLELSTRSQLALKPRSGGMMMSYSAKF